ncbi:UNVERIFIED_CONTAM: hypothetical protein FKN15_007231 [Acipenser sinensis]
MSLPPLISTPDQLDFLFEFQSSWDHPATAPAVSRSIDTLYRVHDAEKLGLAHFPPVEASIATLVQTPNLALLSKDAACPNRQCRVSELILKRAYSANTFATRLGNFNSILVAYQSHLLGPSLRTTGPHHNSWMSCAWLSQAHVPDEDKAPLLDTTITSGHTFGPAVDEMLQHSHREREYTKELVHLLPK